MVPVRRLLAKETYSSVALLAALDQVRERAAEEIEVQVEGNEAGEVGEHQ
jgi:hypothetical protein